MILITHRTSYPHSTLLTIGAPQLLFTGNSCYPSTYVQVNMLLFNLDQYSRTRMPNYTGYKPKEARNISVVQPAQGPTTATTSGWEAAQVIARARTLAPGVNDKEFAINSRHGIMGFFTGGQESVSGAKCMHGLIMMNEAGIEPQK